MIGVDTNVLVRVFVPDSVEETQAALDFMAQRSVEDPAFIGIVVLIELAWVLKRSYGFGPEAISEAIESLFESANVQIENTASMERIVRDAAAAHFDLADGVIAAAALAAGADRIVTFDRKASRRVRGMELLE